MAGVRPYSYCEQIQDNTSNSVENKRNIEILQNKIDQVRIEALQDKLATTRKVNDLEKVVEELKKERVYSRNSSRGPRSSNNI